MKKVEMTSPQREQKGKPPDWKELPEQKRQEMVMILAEMLLNCERRAREGDDEAQS